MNHFWRFVILPIVSVLVGSLTFQAVRYVTGSNWAGWLVEFIVCLVVCVFVLDHLNRRDGLY